MRIILTLIAITAGFGAEALVPGLSETTGADAPGIAAPYEAPVLRVLTPLKSGWECDSPVDV